MLIEAFSQARDPAWPGANEDALVILPGRAYAVIDGVSDRTGVRYDGMLAGRYAATLVASTLERLLANAPPPPETIVAVLTAAIADAYRRFGVMEKAAQDWGGRICCTLALALTDADRVAVLLIGDSGIRLNGVTTLRLEKDLDTITATLRRHAWRMAASRVADPAMRERLSRQVTWHGSEQPAASCAPVLDQDDLAAMGAAAEAECATRLPHVPAADVSRLVRTGIVKGQGPYQNRADLVLGYSALDGFDIPPGLMRVAEFPSKDIETIELFTDGYFRPGDGFGVDAWEQAARLVEAEDPAKVDRYLSTKGSMPGQFADDRTYLGVSRAAAFPSDRTAAPA